MLPALLLALQSSDRAALTQGVGELTAPGALPGAMVASDRAEVVLQAEGKPVAVSVRVAAGRVLAVGHGSFFNDGNLDDPANGRFFANALTWLGNRPLTNLRLGTIGFEPVDRWAHQTKVQVTPLRANGLTEALRRIDVLAIGQDTLSGDQASQRVVVEWVREGHGLLISGPAWGWQQLNPNKNLLRDHAGNQMLLPVGVGFSGETADGVVSPKGADDPLLQTDSALAALRKGSLSTKDASRASDTVARALALSPAKGPLEVEIEREAKKENVPDGPTHAHPFDGMTPFSRLRAVVEDRTWRAGKGEKSSAASSASDFPGAVPANAKRVTRRITVDTSVPDWHSTGLYAAPGETIRIKLSSEAIGKGLAVRIGSQTDTLWHLAKWERFPAISRQWPLDSTEIRVSSPFGGAVFIDVPAESTAVQLDLTIEGAVPAPLFVRGTTTKEEWAKNLAEAGGPWVELVGNRVTLSLPREAVVELRDPEALMAFWDRMMDLAYAFYAEPPRPRPERYSVDRQISAGYMHSGYPIMTGDDVAKTFADLPKLEGKGATWGFFHEMGHNFQQEAWTFDGTGEVTNNLFSLYASEKLNGIVPAEYGLAHKAMAPEAQRTRLAAYLASRAKFEEWKRDPFLALTMYAEVREAFGWEPFTKAFVSYRSDPPNVKSELDRHDEWMIRLSRTTGHNLGPFFMAWGVPTSEAARQSIANLPSWMPADWPKP